MQLIYILLILCVAMAAIKVAITALLVIFGIGLLYCAIRHPVQTTGFMLMMATVSLLERHPLAAGVGLIAMAIASMASRNQIGGN